jgi:hypothetical protein
MIMIDREARDILAESFRHLVAGQITNDQFEGRLRKSEDAGVSRVYFCAAWPLYDDFREHKLTGRWAIKREHWPIVARYILFLKTDVEYEWPTTTRLWAFPWNIPWGVLTLATFGLAERIWSRTMDRRSGGDVNVWPFFRMSDLEAAKEQHPYLADTKETPNQAIQADDAAAPRPDR